MSAPENKSSSEPASAGRSNDHSPETLQLFSQLVEQTSDVLTAADIHFKPLTWNKAAENIYGLKAEQVIGHDIRDFLSIDYTSIDREEVRSIIHEKGEWRGEASFTRPTDREKVTLWMCFKQLKNEDCHVKGYLISAIDITERKKYELRLKETERQLIYQSIILENVSDIIITTDLEFNVRMWNRIAEEYYGIKETDAIGKKMSGLIDFVFHGTSIQQALSDLLRDGVWKGEVSFTKNGQTFHLLESVQYVHDTEGNKIGFLAIGHDITKKKQAEERLKESESFYRSLIANSLDGIILVDSDGRISFASPSIKNVLGFDAEEITGKNSFEFVHPEDIAWAFESFQKEVDENPEIKFITVRLLKKDGNWVWCMVRGHNLLDNPHVNSIVIYFHDDTLRKEAKDALKESEKRFRSLIRDLRIGVFLSDGDGTIIMCNRALALMLSIPEEFIVGKNVYQIMADDMINEQHEFIPLGQRPLNLAIHSRQPVKDAVFGVLHPITQERSWIMVNADPFIDESGQLKHIVCSVMDLTERKKLERKLVIDQVAHQKQLTQATIEGQEKERREIGKELHDNIGQQLTTIKLFLDFAKTTADENTLEMVNMALKGVSDVINEVRAISRSLVPYTLKDLGLVESIQELTESFERTQLLKIKFTHSHFDEEALPENQKLGLFRIVQEQLNNIVKHADAKNVSIQLRARSGETVLEIKDDGNGFDGKKVRRGLGFINIRNRAELFNGKADIQSHPGDGCLLTVAFPQVFVDRKNIEQMNSEY